MEVGASKKCERGGYNKWAWINSQTFKWQCVHVVQANDEIITRTNNLEVALTNLSTWEIHIYKDVSDMEKK